MCSLIAIGIIHYPNNRPSLRRQWRSSRVSVLPINCISSGGGKSTLRKNEVCVRYCSGVWVCAELGSYKKILKGSDHQNDKKKKTKQTFSLLKLYLTVKIVLIVLFAQVLRYLRIWPPPQYNGSTAKSTVEQSARVTVDCCRWFLLGLFTESARETRTFPLLNFLNEIFDCCECSKWFSLSLTWCGGRNTRHDISYPKQIKSKLSAGINSYIYTTYLNEPVLLQGWLEASSIMNVVMTLVRNYLFESSHWKKKLQFPLFILTK